MKHTSVTAAALATPTAATATTTSIATAAALATHVTLGFLNGESNTDVVTIYFDAVGAVQNGGLKHCYKIATIKKNFLQASDFKNKKKHFLQASDYLCAAGFLECHKAEAAAPVRCDNGIGYLPVPLAHN